MRDRTDQWATVHAGMQYVLSVHNYTDGTTVILPSRSETVKECLERMAIRASVHLTWFVPFSSSSFPKTSPDLTGTAFASTFL